MIVTLFGIVTVPVRPDPSKALGPIVRSALPGSKLTEVRDLHPSNADASMCKTVFKICKCPFSTGPYLVAVAQPAAAKGTSSPIVRSALPGSKITEVRDSHTKKASDSGKREVWAR